MAISRRVLVFVAMVPMIAACQFVLGLNDYKPGDADAGGGLDASNDALVLPETFAAKVSWAQWRMPNPVFDSGVDAKYNFGTLQSGTVDGGTVFFDRYLASDGGTGLVWFVPKEATAATEAAAEAHCGTNGRLPSRIELVTLLDFTATGPRVMAGGSQPAFGPYWTSSPDRPYRADSGVLYWTVTFDQNASTPITTFADKDSGASPNVLCVLK